MIGEIYSLIIFCLGGIGLFSNFLLIYFILRYTMKEMKIYNRILLQTCIVDIIAIFVYISDRGVGTVWEYGPTHYLSNPWQCICFMIFGFICRFTTMNVCSQFVFRYLSVVRNIKIKWKMYGLILFLFIFPIALLFILSFIAFHPTEENEYLTNYEIINILEIDNKTIKDYVVGMRANTSSNLSGFILIYALIFTILSYIIIILCGISIQLYVRKNYKGPNLETMRQVNRQMTIVLSAQALLPLLTFIPQLYLNFTLFFNFPVNTKLIMILGTPITELIAILNPLVTLLSVKNYRQLLIKYLYCGRQILRNGNNNNYTNNTNSNNNNYAFFK
ncbi:hypothetical protein Mgra_00001603 [Meloidogyne graminicola]|uniref:G-protein coupled receptors family 1 profile domain-containing protein n=1 Tax=Meloidogyne graminicola TaxID=189291 RepID=A0A8S9ZZM1_9BILA|nr:hypothetical protein Mgra_00001603 [Meloidogyne graminicola]